MIHIDDDLAGSETLARFLVLNLGMTSRQSGPGGVDWAKVEWLKREADRYAGFILGDGLDPDDDATGPIIGARLGHFAQIIQRTPVTSAIELIEIGTVANHLREMTTLMAYGVPIAIGSAREIIRYATITLLGIGWPIN